MGGDPTLVLLNTESLWALSHSPCRAGVGEERGCIVTNQAVKPHGCFTQVSTLLSLAQHWW